MGDTEKGFGTGLRAQLAKKKADLPPQGIANAPAPPDDGRAQRRAGDGGPAGGTALRLPRSRRLRAELGAALAREQELRGSLSRQIETVERGESREKLAEREAELVQKAGELSAAGDALDERERRLVEQERELTERSKLTEVTHGELKPFARSSIAPSASRSRRSRRQSGSVGSSRPRAPKRRRRRASTRRAGTAEARVRRPFGPARKLEKELAERQSRIERTEAQLAERESDLAQRLTAREQAIRRATAPHVRASAK